MITLFTHAGPNPHKISIALEELGLPYRTEEVDVFGAGPTPELLALNPNGKVPVIRDEGTGEVVFESNAILLYLAEKTGRLMPAEPRQRRRALQLLFFQAASIGPMFGQRAWFSLFAPEKPAYAVERYRKEGERLHGVLETLLTGRTWFLDDYSIVDIAHFGWVWCAVHQGFPVDAYPSVKAWYDRVAARPAAKKGVTVPTPLPDFARLRDAA